MSKAKSKKTERPKLKDLLHALKEEYLIETADETGEGGKPGDFRHLVLPWTY